MNFNDKPAFRKKMEQIARKVDRRIDDEQCDIFFDDLKDFPVNIALSAMDLALRDRDVDDHFLTRAMLTIPEIRRSAEELIKEKKEIGKLGCDKCEGTKGWILEITKTGRAVAHPCDCLAELCRAELKRKGRTRGDRVHDEHRESILVAYEVSKLR
jgi:hypothetical protein